MKLKILLITQLLLLFLQGLSLLKDGFTDWKTRKNFPSSSLTLSAAAVATIHNSTGETEAAEKKGKLVRKLLPIFPSRQTNNSLALSLQSCVLPSAANKNFILSTFHFTLTQFFTTMMKVYDEEWKSSHEMTTFLVSYELMCVFPHCWTKKSENHAWIFIFQQSVHFNWGNANKRKVSRMSIFILTSLPSLTFCQLEAPANSCSDTKHWLKRTKRSERSEMIFFLISTRLNRDFCRLSAHIFHSSSPFVFRRFHHPQPKSITLQSQEEWVETPREGRIVKYWQTSPKMYTYSRGKTSTMSWENVDFFPPHSTVLKSQVRQDWWKREKF